MDRLLRSNALAATILVRLAAGAVFLTEGIQKFLYPDALGVGRFVKIGIPAAQFFAPFVGVVEIVCGTLFLAGLFTRLSAVPLVIDMIVAIATTILGGRARVADRFRDDSLVALPAPGRRGPVVGGLAPSGPPDA